MLGLSVNEDQTSSDDEEEVEYEIDSNGENVDSS